MIQKQKKDTHFLLQNNFTQKSSHNTHTIQTLIILQNG